MQQFFQSTDPRGQDRQLGTVGGDLGEPHLKLLVFKLHLGEFLTVLNAIEQETQKEYSSAEVLHIFKRYLTAMSREKFFFAIDLDAIESFKTACGCPQLNIADPPEVLCTSSFFFCQFCSSQRKQFCSTHLTLRPQTVTNFSERLLPTPPVSVFDLS